MMEVQEALNYLVLEYQTNHDFRWGLFTVGGVVLNAVLMLCVGRFGKSKPIAVDVLKSYEKPKIEYLGAEEIASMVSVLAQNQKQLTLTAPDKKDLATGVPPAPTPIEAPKEFSPVVNMLLKLPDFTWMTEWSRQVQDSEVRLVDEYLAYQTGNILIGYVKSLFDKWDMTRLVLVDPQMETILQRTKSDFTSEEWTALQEKFNPIREKVLAHDKEQQERKELQILRQAHVGPLTAYNKEELISELKRREQKSV